MNLKTILLTFFGLALTEALTGEEAVSRFFDYFKQENPVGIPVAQFDEPMEIFSPLDLVPISLTNGTILGHSNISIESAMINFITMEAKAVIKAPRLEIGGKYSWPGFFGTSEGDMNATITHSEIIFNISMFVDLTDTLQISDMQLLLDNEEVFLNLTDLGFEHRLLLSSGGIHLFFAEFVQEIFRQVKPLLLSKANGELVNFVSNLPPAIRLDGDELLNTSNIQYFLQRFMNYVGMEPLRLANQNSVLLGVTFQVTDMVLHGMSVIKEIQSMHVFYFEKQIYLEIDMTYPKLLLFYSLGLSTGSVINLDLYEKIQLNNFDLKLKLIIDPTQENPPFIKDLDVHVESFGKLRTGRQKGFFNIVRNFLLGVADDIRNEIIKALTGPIQNIIQGELNNLDIEDAVLHLMKRKTK